MSGRSKLQCGCVQPARESKGYLLGSADPHNNSTLIVWQTESLELHRHRCECITKTNRLMTHRTFCVVFLWDQPHRRESYILAVFFHLKFWCILRRYCRVYPISNCIKMEEEKWEYIRWQKDDGARWAWTMHFPHKRTMERSLIHCSAARALVHCNSKALKSRCTRIRFELNSTGKVILFVWNVRHSFPSFASMMRNLCVSVCVCARWSGRLAYKRLSALP